jgi:hypothetical protein
MPAKRTTVDALDFVPSMDHAAALEGVISTINIIASNTNVSEDELIHLLRDRGYSRIAAEKLNVFVPSAFSWPVLKKLGLASFPDHFLATGSDGAEVKIPIASQHYFTAALTLAYSTFQNGWTETLPRSVYEVVAARSAEMDIINKVYEDGGSVEEGTLSPLQLLRMSAEEVLET